MKLANLVGLILVTILLAACTPSATAPSPMPSPSKTPLPTPTSVPTNTPFPEPISGYLYNWPIPMLPEDQIQEVLDCQNETWYGDNMLDPESIEISNPDTACEFGLLAVSLIDDFDQPKFNNESKLAAQQAVLQNPGIIFSNPYFFFAIHTLDLADPPPLSSISLDQVTIQYEWRGMGTPVNFEVSIVSAESTTATGSVEKGSDPLGDEETRTNRTFQQEMNPKNVQALGKSLKNLIPVKKQGPMFSCYDNYPDWIITLEYENGEEITLRTNESNYFIEGGPFQTEIDGQNYILASYAFNLALLKIIDELELPLGEPAGMACIGFPVAELLYTDITFPDQ